MKKFGWIVFILGVLSLLSGSISTWILNSLLKVQTQPNIFLLIIDACAAYLGWRLIGGSRNKIVFGLTIFIFVIWCVVFSLNSLAMFYAISSR